MIENVIIIGGGPAGLSAAIYLARAGLKPLLFAGSPPGGQLTLTSDVENFPGFEAINGAELITRMRKQAEKFGTKIVDENIIKVDFSKKPFQIFLDSTSNQSKSVILATGAKALWLGLESEKRLRGKGVSACATCDGFFFKDKTVAVVGGGDTACEDALTITKFASKVYLIHRKNELRASKIMQKRVKENPKIELILSTTVEEVLGENRVVGIKIRNTKSEIRNLDVNGVFVAIGHKPDTELFKDQIELDERGYVKLKIRRSTSVEGVFAAGDCADPYYRQAATAAGTGIEAALEVERWLENLQ